MYRIYIVVVHIHRLGYFLFTLGMVHLYFPYLVKKRKKFMLLIKNGLKISLFIKCCHLVVVCLMKHFSSSKSCLNGLFLTSLFPCVMMMIVK